MRLSRSMENLHILPEEAKLANSLLRLTLSDQQDASTSDFQSYISEHSQFPYHKNVQIQKSVSTSSKMSLVASGPVTKRQLRTIPISTCREKNNNVNASCMLSQSAPPESQGFFRRLFPSFRRKSETESRNRSETATICKRTTVISANKSEVKGPIVLQFTRISSNMDNLIFMSLR